MSNRQLIHLETRPRQEHSGRKVRTSTIDRLSVLKNGRRRIFVTYSSRGSWREKRDDHMSHR